MSSVFLPPQAGGELSLEMRSQLCWPAGFGRIIESCTLKCVLDLDPGRACVFVFTCIRASGMLPPLSAMQTCICAGLARTVYIHRIWPYIWWFPCLKYRMCTVYICFWPTLRMCWVATCSQFPYEGQSGSLTCQWKTCALLLTLRFHAQEKQVTCWNSALYVLSSDLFLTCR